MESASTPLLEMKSWDARIVRDGPNILRRSLVTMAFDRVARSTGIYCLQRNEGQSGSLVLRCWVIAVSTRVVAFKS